MVQKFFVSPVGAFIGSFDGAVPPTGAVEVPSPPADIRQRWGNGTWLPSAFKDDLRALVNSLRDEARKSAPWSGHLVDTNQASLINISGRAAIYASGRRTDPSQWIMADNAVVDLSAEQFLSMAAAVDAWIDTCYTRAATIKAQIAAGLLTTPEQVRAAWETT